jgi:hypothetical protein
VPQPRRSRTGQGPPRRTHHPADRRAGPHRHRPRTNGETHAQQAPRRRGGEHTKADCALRDHATLGRYLRQLKSGRLRIDRAAISAEARLDGKYLLSTSDPDLPTAGVVPADLRRTCERDSTILETNGISPEAGASNARV